MRATPVTVPFANTTPESFDRHPFTGPRGRPIDMDCRRVLARLTPLEEAVLRLHRGIGTESARSLEEVTAFLRISPDEIRRMERKALSLLGSPAKDCRS